MLALKPRIDDYRIFKKLFDSAAEFLDEDLICEGMDDLFWIPMSESINHLRYAIERTVKNEAY